MTKSEPARSGPLSPISLRVTPEERAALENAAKGTSLSNYIRSRLFAPETGMEAEIVEVSRLSPITRQQLLAQILGELGRSGIAQSLSDLGYAAQIGVLPLTPEVLADIRSACAHIAEMRSALLRGLGLRPGGGP